MDIMDIIIALLFMISAFLMPKLWKEYMLKVNQYPQGRNQGGVRAEEETILTDEIITEITSDSATHMGNIQVSDITPAVTERAVWQGKMDVNAVINGVIFAEIVQPPRAYRPFVHRK